MQNPQLVEFIKAHSGWEVKDPYSVAVKKDNTVVINRLSAARDVESPWEKYNPYRLDFYVDGLFKGLQSAHLPDAEKLDYLRRLRDGCRFGFKDFEGYPGSVLSSGVQAVEGLGLYIMGYVTGIEYEGPIVTATRIN